MAETVIGELLRVAFYKPDSWQTRLVVNVNDERFAVDGEACLRPVDGMTVRAVGEFQPDERGIRRLKASTLTLLPPMGGHQRIRYLRRLLHFLPASMCERIATYPGDLGDTLVPGLPLPTAQRVQRAWRDSLVPSSWAPALAAAKISRASAPSIARAALDTGEDVEDVLRDRPYRLCALGASWKEVERIGHDRGIAEDDPDRVLAGLRHVLQDAAGSGHTGLSAGEVKRRAQRILGNVDVDAVVDAALRADTLSATRDGLLQLPALSKAERTIGSHVVRLLRTPQHPQQRAADIEGLTDEQAHGVRGALTSRFSVITGGPGTGKTTALRHIISSWSGDVMLAAPTGTAAFRMATAAQRKAKTVQSMLRGFRESDGTWRFSHDESKPLEGRRLLVVVDEATMLDTETAASLLAAVPHDGTILFMGDVDQLPSVGAGAVFRDLLAAGVPTTRLTKAHRYGSAIAEFATAIRDGDASALTAATGPIRFVSSANASDTLGEVNRLIRGGADMRDIMVLSAAYAGSNGVNVLNATIKQLVNPAACQNVGGRLAGIPIVRHWNRPKGATQAPPPAEATWMAPGDRVITREPEYTLNVRNGEAGLVLSCGFSKERVPWVEVLTDDGDMRIYEGPETGKLDLAYAMSVHRAQGHQKPHVVLAASGREGIVLSHECFYTGITRVQDTLTIVGPEDRLGEVISRRYHEPRLTALREQLRPLTLERPGVRL